MCFYYCFCVDIYIVSLTTATGVSIEESAEALIFKTQAVKTAAHKDSAEMRAIYVKNWGGSPRLPEDSSPVLVISHYES